MSRLFSLPLILLPGLLWAQLPAELESTRFSGPEITPSPACLAAAPTGEVFVGVDMLGSLGKGPGKGKIIRLIDEDQDGVADSHTEFAKIDNPRGLIPVGNQLFVLHTVIPESVGKLTGMHLSVFEDKDWDGVADGPYQILVSDVSPPKHNQDRGADHTTNGIRMGIDGWIYIAVGDFGIHGAKGTDGTELTMLGGGVVRVRPDGTELEVYTTGLRNIYDIAIDPLMNIYTRGNTNDGGGWNVRFIHHIQSAHYGYPMHFKNFTGEILPALEDLGGGSGTGSMYFQEPGWPAKFNNQPMMCDWGRSTLYIHRLKPDGASFTQEPEVFLKVNQISDVDCDGSSALYVAAWDGAGYKGSSEKGYVQRVVPKGWTYQAFPDLAKASPSELVALIGAASAKARLHAQQAILRRGDPSVAEALLAMAKSHDASLDSRVAAIFTYKQLLGEGANAELVQLAGDAVVREWALRAATDRKTQLGGLSKDVFAGALRDSNPRVQVAAAVSLGRLGDVTAAEALLAVANPLSTEGQKKAPTEPPVFMSKILKGDETQDIDIDLTGFEKLHLHTTDGGNGSGLDHSSWFDPILVMADGSEVPLSEGAKQESAEVGWGKIAVGKAPNGNALKRHDGTPSPTGLGSHAPSSLVYKLPPGAKRFKATIGIASTSDKGGSSAFAVHNAIPRIPGTPSAEGPHAKPNAAIILPHVAVKALTQLKAVDASLGALNGPNRQGALWALRYQFEPKVVETVLAQAKNAQGTQREELTELLARLYQREKAYDGSWWWGTRPDTRGPFYVGETWEASAGIEQFLLAEYQAAETDRKRWLALLNENYRMDLSGIEPVAVAAVANDEPKVDLSMIAGKAGEIGKMSIEDVMLALDTHKGDPKKGAAIFTTQGCIACHTTEVGQPLKGPHMGQVGAVLSREQIAESILKPNASISQGFATVMISTKDGKSVTGFVTGETSDQLELRDIAGQVHKVKAADVAQRHELEISMMPPGLANALSVDDFASLVAYLASKKG
tara:strand:- start:3964 stop:6996 length:3033 start_codon:yes stop_codon:yes gene_type:complete